MIDVVGLGEVADALRCGPHEHIALVGGGGKTTLLHALARQLRGPRVLTTTTKMGADQHGGYTVLIDPTDEEVRAAAAEDPVVVWHEVAAPKAIGVDPQRCDRWFELVDHVVVEADGARTLPFKAPAPYEPVVPSTATLVVSVIGADALGRVIADCCHRPERVAALAQCSPSERLTPQAAARVLLHERGARRDLPPKARFVVTITKVADANRSLVEDLVAVLGPTTVVAIAAT